MPKQVPPGGGTGATQVDSTQKQQSYTFDAFGNLTVIGGTNGRNTPTSSQTNLLNGTGTAYDAAGNLTNWNSAAYSYDAFNQMVRMTSGSEDWAYVYTADDERIWMYNLAANSSRWTVRDLGGKVLREYLNNQGAWSVGTDYIYRDGLLLAAETQSGQRHFHLDHLGTPRLITRAGGERVAYHVYFPFGEEATAFNQDTERMKFTGHERDLASPTGAGDDLDYMHARHESPVTGRFLSVDSVLDMEIAAKNPQTWNRYTYVRNNPQRFTDPAGKYLCSGSSEECGIVRQAIQAIRTAASNLPAQSPHRVALQKILTFYGREDKDNGVTVKVTGGMALGFGDTKNGKTTITLNLELMSDINGGKDNDKFSAEAASTLAHEGQHGIDDRRYGNPANRVMEMRTETNAARTEAYVYEGFRIDAPWGTWTQAVGISPENIRKEAEASTKAWCEAGGNCR